MTSEAHDPGMTEMQQLIERIFTVAQLLAQADPTAAEKHDSAELRYGDNADPGTVRHSNAI